MVDTVHLSELADTHFREHPHTSRILTEARAEIERLQQQLSEAEARIETDRRMFVELGAAQEGLRAALKECADRLERCAISGGNAPDVAAIAVSKYRELLEQSGAK
jgi:chromosome segregation ATPase